MMGFDLPSILEIVPVLKVLELTMAGVYLKSILDVVPVLKLLKRLDLGGLD